MTLLLAAFAVNLDTTLVNVALPDLSRQLDASTARLQWVGDAYRLVFAAAVTVGSMLGTGLAARIGTKQIVTAGLLLTDGFYAWSVGTTAHLSYIVISMLMAIGRLGMGLTSAPGTESIMGAISTKTAGVGSAVNDTTRLVGGTLGVAVIGSVFSSLYQQRVGHDLATSPVTGGALATVKDSVHGGFTVARGLAHTGSPVGDTIHQATTSAFMHGLHAACVVAAITAFLGALE